MKLYIIAYQYTEREEEFDWLHAGFVDRPTDQIAKEIARGHRRVTHDILPEDEDYMEFPDTIYIDEVKIAEANIVLMQPGVVSDKP